jgi:NADH dehydrogenase/NADH:ubiquinone oxidoreductase subunit G
MENSDLLNITIDGKTVLTPKNSTLLEAIRSTGKDIPIICFHPATTPEGICRQCVVEVEGWRTLAASCVTKVTEGMVIHTQSERVIRSRRTILEMLNATVDLTETPALLLQMSAINANPNRFPEAKPRGRDLIDDNPFYIRDYKKCLMCWRCVQACGNDMQFTYALSIGGRGYNSKITTFFDAPMPDTTCVFCGNCVVVCPTNALKDKTEYYLDMGIDYDQIRQENRAAYKIRKSKREPDAN